MGSVVAWRKVVWVALLWGLWDTFCYVIFRAGGEEIGLLQIVTVNLLAAFVLIGVIALDSWVPKAPRQLHVFSDLERKRWERRGKWYSGWSIRVTAEGRKVLNIQMEPATRITGRIVGVQVEPVGAYLVKLDRIDAEPVALTEEMIERVSRPDTQPRIFAYTFGYVPERVDFSDN